LEKNFNLDFDWNQKLGDILNEKRKEKRIYEERFVIFLKLPHILFIVRIVRRVQPRAMSTI